MSSPLEPFKVDYSSFYKFIASVGLILIASAAAIPWFVMRAAVPEAVTGSDAAKTIELAAETRAEQYLKALNVYPWVSLVLIVFGMLLTFYGLIAWKKRQAKHDADEDETYRQRRALGKTTAGTAAEKEAKLEGETDSADLANAESAPMAGRTAGASMPSSAQSADDAQSAAGQARMSAMRSEQRDRLRRTENDVGRLLDYGFASTHEVETGVRVVSPEAPTRTSILDFVARANEPDRWTSFAVEVRVTTARGLVGISDSFRRNIINVAIAARGVPEGPLPSGSRGRPALAKSVSLLVVVISEPNREEPQSSLQRRMLANLSDQILHRTIELNSILSRKVGVIVVHERTLATFDGDEFGAVVVSVLRDPLRPYIDDALMSLQ